MNEKAAGRKEGDRWVQRLFRMSFRMRLGLSFVCLIVSSATATIFIGNAVFGQKAQELARDRLELDLKFADQTMTNRLQQLRLLAPAISGMVSGSRIDPLFCSYRLEDVPFEFAAVVRKDAISLMDARRGSCAVRSVQGDEYQRFVTSQLGEMGHAAGRDKGTSSGLVVVSRQVSEDLGYPGVDSGGLFMAAASRLETGDVLIIGAILNGRAELGSNVQYASSVFLGDRRIATTLGPGSIGTQADPEVARAVLEAGTIFVGDADVLGKRQHNAYEPLRDFQGRIVGMLGITSSQDLYGYVRDRTITLFTTLIAAGMVFGIIMAWWFSKELIRPVADLAKGMDRVAQGDLTYKVRIDSMDELGQLAHAFNLMVKAVMDRDIQLREMTDQKLSQVEKQISIGRLAAGVAHEINNPLTAVLSLSMLMRKHLPADDDRAPDLDIIITETTRCRDIVRSLLDFARERPPEMQRVDVNQVLRDTLVLTAAYEAMGQRRIEVNLSESSLCVSADAKQLKQVFMNILINAAEATQNDGVISITTDEDSSGGFVVVSVRDNGRGLPKDLLNRVFEPFFTTKAGSTASGTGLGLSVSLGIIQRHGGYIEMESAEGNGCKVSVVLPKDTSGKEAVSASA